MVYELILESVFQAIELQTRYMELLTLSDDYYRFLGELLKNMEELKVLLFEYLCLLQIFSDGKVN